MKPIRLHPLRILSILLILFLTFILFFHRTSSTSDYEKYHTKLLKQMEHADTFSAFTDSLFCLNVTTDSITTTYTLKDPASFEIPNLPPLLTAFHNFDYQNNQTQQTNEKQYAFLENQLQSYKKSTLSKEEQITHELLSKEFAIEKAFCKYPYYEELLGSTTGIQANLPITLGEFPFRNENDVKCYLNLLDQIPAYFNDVIAYEKQREKIGYHTPYFLRLETYDELTSLVENLKSENNCFLETFHEKISTLHKQISNKKISAYCKQNNEKIQKRILPAYQNLLNYIKTSATQPNSSTNITLSSSSSRNKSYLPDPNTAYGLCTLPNGKNYYALLVKSNTGSSHSLEELITLTEDKLSTTIENVTNIACTDTNTYLYYCDHPAQTYYEDPATILQALSLLIRDQYPTLATTPTYKIKNVPESLAANLSPAFYMVPALDDFSDNTIYINPLYTSNKNNNLFTTLAHEGFPGHLYQTVYFNNTNADPIRKILNYPGYVEGWATYVEIHAFPYMSNKNTNQNLCSLYQADTIISLALSARVDFGVNYEGWTLNDVNHFFEKNGFKSYYAADLYTYVVEAPATYLRYFIGYLEIEQLKDDYQKQEKENYSDLSFHKAFLDFGPADFETIRNAILHNPYPTKK